MITTLPTKAARRAIIIKEYKQQQEHEEQDKYKEHGEHEEREEQECEESLQLYDKEQRSVSASSPATAAMQPPLQPQE